MDEQQHAPADQTESLKQFIQQQLHTGLHPDEIANQLRQVGWHEEQIAQAFQAVQAQIAPTPVNPVVTTLYETEQAPVQQGQFVQEASQTPSQKRGRTKTGWLLFKQSLRVIRTNKALTRYVFMSAMLSFVLVVVFAVIFASARHALISAESLNGTSRHFRPTLAGLVVGLAYYVLAFFVVNLYAAGLAANAIDLFQGSAKPYREYMQKARARGGVIFMFSVIEATVGMILRIAAERLQLLGRITVRLVGALWSIARLFVIPVIITSDKNAVAAIKESVLLLKSTWGENIVGRVSFGLSVVLAFLLLLIPSSVLLFLLFGVLIGGNIGVTIAIALIIVLCVMFGIVASAASSVLNTALFYYAHHKQIPAAFNADLLNSVFIRKKRRGWLGRKAAA